MIKDCPNCQVMQDDKARTCNNCGYIFTIPRAVPERHPHATAVLHDAPTSERKYGMSWARIMTPVGPNRIQLQIMDIDTTVIDIIEGPLDMVLNDYILRGTGLRIYKDRRGR